MSYYSGIQPSRSCCSKRRTSSAVAALVMADFTRAFSSLVINLPGLKESARVRGSSIISVASIRLLDVFVAEIAFARAVGKFSEVMKRETA
jgi:hypothetical protein